MSHTRGPMEVVEWYDEIVLNGKWAAMNSDGLVVAEFEYESDAHLFVKAGEMVEALDCVQNEAFHWRRVLDTSEVIAEVRQLLQEVKGEL